VEWIGAERNGLARSTLWLCRRQLVDTPLQLVLTAIIKHESENLSSRGTIARNYWILSLSNGGKNSRWLLPRETSSVQTIEPGLVVIGRVGLEVCGGATAGTISLYVLMRR
jgi:hypothetical protein